MPARRKNPLRLCDEYVKCINDSVKRWNFIIRNGCCDPLWPDGVNLNLVRNHIISAKCRILDLCAEKGMIPPEEAFYELPPKVPTNLFTGDPESERAKRLLSFRENLIFPEEPIPLYDPFPPGQISLF